jgi:hypothetical protein
VFVFVLQHTQFDPVWTAYTTLRWPWPAWRWPIRRWAIRRWSIRRWAVYTSVDNTLNPFSLKIIIIIIIYMPSQLRPAGKQCRGEWSLIYIVSVDHSSWKQYRHVWPLTTRLQNAVYMPHPSNMKESSVEVSDPLSNIVSVDHAAWKLYGHE